MAWYIFEARHGTNQQNYDKEIFHHDGEMTPIEKADQWQDWSLKMMFENPKGNVTEIDKVPDSDLYRITERYRQTASKAMAALADLQEPNEQHTFMVSATRDHLETALGEKASIKMMVAGDNGICAWETDLPAILKNIGQTVPASKRSQIRFPQDFNESEKETILSTFAAGSITWPEVEDTCAPIERKYIYQEYIREAIKKEPQIMEMMSEQG